MSNRSEMPAGDPIHRVFAVVGTRARIASNCVFVLRRNLLCHDVIYPTLGSQRWINLVSRRVN